MPPFGGIIKTSDDLWKIISWIRSVNPKLNHEAAAPIVRSGRSIGIEVSNRGQAACQLGGFSLFMRPFASLLQDIVEVLHERCSC